jgi:hypothetical protein
MAKGREGTVSVEDMDVAVSRRGKFRGQMAFGSGSLVLWSSFKIRVF